MCKVIGINEMWKFYYETNEFKRFYDCCNNCKIKINIPSVQYSDTNILLFDDKNMVSLIENPMISKPVDDVENVKSYNELIKVNLFVCTVICNCKIIHNIC